MAPQIPYAAIGTGIAVVLGIWAFLIAETAKERAVIGGVPVLLLFAGSLFHSLSGGVIVLIGWILYGIGCIIFLRFNGMGVR